MAGSRGLDPDFGSRIREFEIRISRIQWQAYTALYFQSFLSTNFPSLLKPFIELLGVSKSTKSPHESGKEVKYFPKNPVGIQPSVASWWWKRLEWKSLTIEIKILFSQIV